MAGVIKLYFLVTTLFLLSINLWMLAEDRLGPLTENLRERRRSRGNETYFSEAELEVLPTRFVFSNDFPKRTISDRIKAAYAAGSEATLKTVYDKGLTMISEFGTQVKKAVWLEPPENQITFVLMARKGDKEGFPRLPALLASLTRFARPGTIRELIVVVPGDDEEAFLEGITQQAKEGYLWKKGSRVLYIDQEAELWREIIKNDPSAKRYFTGMSSRETFPVRVMTDRQVLPTSRGRLSRLLPVKETKAEGGRGASYRMQMLMKIGIAKFVTTDFFITLDCDVFAKRLFGFNDLVLDKGTKALIQGEAMNGGKTQHRGSWWSSSLHIMQENECIREDEPTIGVTPVVMSKKLALGMMIYIEKMWSNDRDGDEPTRWDELLFRLLAKPTSNDWTEYTLYYSYACVKGMMRKMHSVAPKPNVSLALPSSSSTSSRLNSLKVVTPKPMRLYEYSGFAWGSWETWNPRKEFGNGAIFGVIQSISGADPSSVNRALLQNIEYRRYPGEIVRGAKEKGRGQANGDSDVNGGRAEKDEEEGQGSAGGSGIVSDLSGYDTNPGDYEANGYESPPPKPFSD